MPLVLAILVGASVAWLTWRPIFGDEEGFRRSLRFSFTPDIVSLFRGEWLEDQWHGIKMSLWLICAFVSGAGVVWALG